MKVSDITAQKIAEYLRLDDATDTALLPFLEAARAYVRGYTGLTDEEIDEHPDFVVAVLVLVQDFYDNRTMTPTSSNVNRVIDAILSMHAVNLV